MKLINILFQNYYMSELEPYKQEFLEELDKLRMQQT